MLRAQRYTTWVAEPNDIEIMYSGTVELWKGVSSGNVLAGRVFDDTATVQHSNHVL